MIYMKLLFRLILILKVGLFTKFGIGAIMDQMTPFQHPYKVVQLSTIKERLPLPDFIILDWDGTLVDSKASYIQAFRELCERWNLELDPYMIRRRFGEEGKKGISTGCTRRGIIKEFWPISSRFKEHPSQNEKELFSVVEKEWNEILSSKFTPIKEGAEELLQWTKERNILVAILSGGRDDNHLKQEVKKYFPFFNQDCIYGEEENEENNKPNRGALGRVLEGFTSKVDASKTNGWIIGDDFIDLSFAINCHLQAIVINLQPSLEVVVPLIGDKDIYHAQKLQDVLDALEKAK